MCEETRQLALFDLDGTITPPRKAASDEMVAFLQNLRKVVPIGVVSGSDYAKVKEQLRGEHVHDLVDYLFVENGTSAWKAAQKLSEENLIAKLGETRLKRFINFVLRILSETDVPVKRGTFVELRSAMINISPIGRACSAEERKNFLKYDKEHGVRDKIVQRLYTEFPKDDFGLNFVKGGEISIDCYPVAWDKTYCLKFLENEFDNIRFFGDRTEPGGNDYDIYMDPRTIGHAVCGPRETMRLLREIYFGDSPNSLDSPPKAESYDMTSDVERA